MITCLLLLLGLLGHTQAAGGFVCELLPDSDSCRDRTEWGYEESNGPATWAVSHPDFCAGTAQSPIDLDSTKAMVMNPGEVKMVGYNVAQPAYIGNNGHTLGFGIRSGVTPYIHGGRLPEGDRFDFLQMHWHWGSDSTQGSEHTMDGAMSPIEIHLVHVNSKYDLATALTKSDGLAVLGVFYEISAEDNPALEQILAVVDDVAMQQRMARRKGARATTTEADLPASFMLQDVMPADTTDYYYYQGGLTTPTCNEVVLWTNFMAKATISEAQLAKFRMLTSSDGKTLNNNYRPPQPLGDRNIYATKASVAAVETDLVTEVVNTGITAALITGLVSIFQSVFSPPPAAQQRAATPEELLARGQRQWGNYWN